MHMQKLEVSGVFYSALISVFPLAVRRDFGISGFAIALNAWGRSLRHNPIYVLFSIVLIFLA